MSALLPLPELEFECVPDDPVADCGRHHAFAQVVRGLVKQARKELGDFAGRDGFETTATNRVLLKVSGVSLSTLLAALRWLEARGWIAREPDEQARSGRRIRLLWRRRKGRPAEIPDLKILTPGAPEGSPGGVAQINQEARAEQPGSARKSTRKRAQINQEARAEQPPLPYRESRSSEENSESGEAPSRPEPDLDRRLRPETPASSPPTPEPEPAPEPAEPLAEILERLRRKIAEAARVPNLPDQVPEPATGAGSPGPAPAPAAPGPDPDPTEAEFRAGLDPERLARLDALSAGKRTEVLGMVARGMARAALAEIDAGRPAPQPPPPDTPTPDLIRALRDHPFEVPRAARAIVTAVGDTERSWTYWEKCCREVTAGIRDPESLAEPLERTLAAMARGEPIQNPGRYYLRAVKNWEPVAPAVREKPSAGPP